ncbi:THUMP domain-containing class I SAM-dependent RNA methyltransferase [Pseudooceanicola sp. 502str34]
MTQTATAPTDYKIFLSCPPGLEALLLDEVREAGFKGATQLPGGVTCRGGWPEVWRANLELRGASRVLVRIGEFRAFHLAQLDKRSRKFPWADVLRADVPLRVETTTQKSKIYHAGAATQRIETALKESLGATISPEASLVLKVRIDDNLVTFSVDTSGEGLHKRGHKTAVVKAPMRETMAALLLRGCGYTGDEPVLDPMCGSGTFPIEAAEIALGLQPGRARRFAFEDLATYDAAACEALRRSGPARDTAQVFYGSDRDQGAVRASTANAERAGVAGITRFHCAPLSEVQRPEGPPGLVMINPPYGTRIGNRKMLFALHGAMGTVLKERFSGWRVGIVTSDAGLAKATALPFLPTQAPIAHGGLKVTLFRTDPLP